MAFDSGRAINQLRSLAKQAQEIRAPPAHQPGKLLFAAYLAISWVLGKRRLRRTQGIGPRFAPGLDGPVTRRLWRLSDEVVQ